MLNVSHVSKFFSVKSKTSLYVSKYTLKYLSKIAKIDLDICMRSYLRQVSFTKIGKDSGVTLSKVLVQERKRTS